MASLLLTDRQRLELEEAIYEYLTAQGDKYQSTLESFKREASIREDIEVGKGLLEKKWTSVLRLQKRVLELEAKLSTASFRTASNLYYYSFIFIFIKLANFKS